jgi:hypothetical protein
MMLAKEKLLLSELAAVLREWPSVLFPIVTAYVGLRYTWDTSAVCSSSIKYTIEKYCIQTAQGPSRRYHEAWLQVKSIDSLAVGPSR